MNASYKISVALCTYNADKYLAELLTSILHQTKLPTEIVVCDDASTDTTKQILQEFSIAHPTLFKLHFNDNNLGYIKNFEKCIALCNEQFIAIADHDDIWLPNKLEVLLDKIKDGMLVYSNSQFMQEDGQLINRTLTTQYNFIDKPSPKSFLFSNCVWGHTCMIRKDLIKYAFPIPANAPYDIWIAFVASNVGTISYADEILTYWRQHANSYTSNYLKKSKKQRDIDDWEERIAWLKILLNCTHNSIKEFTAELLSLYLQRQKKFSVKLLTFLIKNRKDLFVFWRKNEVSLLNECRKLSRKIG